MKKHSISAFWLTTENDLGEPRTTIKGKSLYAISKDGENHEKYPFLGYCKNKFAFNIKCLGKKCGWSHEK